ncbi:MAG TPA: dihydrofolate reductase family protein [Aridibacter sp.]|nr:dihydrofolate reductase family protein [Aridibacter sp.]
MSRIRYHVAASLDGYIAGPEGEYDWIVKESAMDFSALFGQFDTFVMGRATYEVATQEGAPPFPPGSNVFVFSRTMREGQDPAVTVMSKVSAEAVDRIRAAARKDVWLFGGGQLLRSFLEGGFVETVEVAVIPVLLGAGLPLLPPPAPRASLRLTKHRVYPSGIVYVEYDVKGLTT